MGVANLIPSSKKKLIAVISIITIIISLVLFIVGIMNQLGFWIIVILIAIIAYKLMPKLK